jgi:hypothetical protein
VQAIYGNNNSSGFPDAMSGNEFTQQKSQPAGWLFNVIALF